MGDIHWDAIKQEREDRRSETIDFIMRFSHYLDKPYPKGVTDMKNEDLEKMRDELRLEFWDRCGGH